MTVLKPRSRLVYFRVTDEEHQRLLSMCEAQGARSLSDLLRMAVERLLSSDADILNDLNTKLRQLNELLSTHQLSELREGLGREAASARPVPATTESERSPE